MTRVQVRSNVCTEVPVIKMAGVVGVCVGVGVNTTAFTLGLHKMVSI